MISEAEILTKLSTHATPEVVSWQWREFSQNYAIRVSKQNRVNIPQCAKFGQKSDRCFLHQIDSISFMALHSMLNCNHRTKCRSERRRTTAAGALGYFSMLHFTFSQLQMRDNDGQWYVSILLMICQGTIASTTSSRYQYHTLRGGSKNCSDIFMAE